MFGIEKKKAQWIQKTHLFKDDDYVCSECGYSSEKPYSECPRCHSNMRGSNYDPSWVDEAEMLDIILGDDF